MNYNDILKLANEVVEMLRPYCERIEIAGSIRRKCAECKDIEIVCIAKNWQLEKYFIDKKYDFIFKKNGVKYKQFHYKDGIYVDLFIADKNNFGLIYLIRTGSAKFNIQIINKAKKQGKHINDGYLWDYTSKINTPEEINVFERLSIGYVPPEKRNIK